MRAENKSGFLYMRLAFVVWIVLILLIFTIKAGVSIADTPPAQPAAGAPASPATSPAPAGSSGDSFRFVVLGDIHMGFEGSSGNPRIPTIIPKIINEIRPSFVIQLGDLISIEGGGSNDRNCVECVNTMWQRVDSSIIDPLTSKGIRFFPTAGNHDGTFNGGMGSDMSRAKRTEHISQLTTKNGNAQISGDYSWFYSFDVEDAHFISFYAPGSQGIMKSSEQMPWLQQDIAQAKARGAKVFFTFAHSPLKAPEMPNNQRSNLPFLANSRPVMTELKAVNDAGIPVVHFGGHIHGHYEGMVEGLRNVISGPLGGGRARFSGTNSYSNWAFMVVDVVDGQFQFYTLEAPDFNLPPDMPPSPTITNPLPITSVPASLAGLGTCPPGTRPQQAPTSVPSGSLANADEGLVSGRTDEPGQENVDEGAGEAPPASSSPTAAVVLVTGAVPTESGAEQPAATPATATSTTTVSGCGTKIALVGDSLTACASNYITNLRTKCGSTTIMNDDGNSGTLCTSARRQPDGDPYFCLQSGEEGDPFAYVCKTTAQMRADFAQVLATRPDTVVIMGGTNDLGGSVDAIKSNLESMYNDARQAGMRVVAVTIPPLKTEATREAGTADKITALNNWIMTTAPVDLRVNIYDDMVAAGTNDVNTSLFGRDQTHPNSGGKEIIAREIHAVLTGAAPAAGAPGSSPVAGAPATVCVPDSAVPALLYDFLINSSAGLTTIIGIARQNIAVGINKTPRRFGIGAVCAPLTADMEYNLDYLKQTYGQSQLSVEAQLVSGSFMGQPVQVHRLVSPAFGCVESEIMNNCPEAQDYEFRAVETYRWQAVPEDPELLATRSFGIAIDVNIDENPNAQDGELVSDIPQCIVDAFRRYGFRWGGDYETAKCPAHFEFMADPNRIVVQDTVGCPEGMVSVTDETTRLRTCRQESAAGFELGDVPIAADENGAVKPCIAQAIHALGERFPYDQETKHPTCCGDWVAMVYKWCGYTYRYQQEWYDNLQELANEYGYPIGYNVNSGTSGHALILLGFGPEAEWWLNQFPDIPVTGHARSVNENEALVISYYGSESQKVGFNVYSRTTYPGNRISQMPGTEGQPVKVKTAHPWVPLCDGQYAPYPARGGQYSDRYAGQMYWTNDMSGAGGPWSRFFEPTESPFYPVAGDCTRQGVPTVAGGKSPGGGTSTTAVA